MNAGENFREKNSRVKLRIFFYAQKLEFVVSPKSRRDKWVVNAASHHTHTGPLIIARGARGKPAFGGWRGRGEKTRREE